MLSADAGSGAGDVFTATVLSAEAESGGGDAFTATVRETGDLDAVALNALTAAAASATLLRPVRTVDAGPPAVRAPPVAVRPRVSVMAGPPGLASAFTPLRTTADRLAGPTRSGPAVESAWTADAESAPELSAAATPAACGAANDKPTR